MNKDKMEQEIKDIKKYNNYIIKQMSIHKNNGYALSKYKDILERETLKLNEIVHFYMEDDYE